jgi:EAL domain-containing protein (putative c-di-GMP-specific phosphodiesterase class I)
MKGHQGIGIIRSWNPFHVFRGLITTMNTHQSFERHTLVFHLQGLPALEVAMGGAVTESTLEAMQAGVFSLAATVLQDEVAQSPLPNLPRGLWAIRYQSPARADDAQAEKQEAIHMAATQLGMELAKDVFGNATIHLARFAIHLLPGHPESRELPTLAEKAPTTTDRDAEYALQRVLETGNLRTFLQPIVHFPDAQHLGFEALSRGPEGSPVERADQLFGVASRLGLSRELEIACAWRALEYARTLSATEWLSINLSSLSLGDEKLRRALARPGIVVEITEHLPLNNARDLLPLLAELRAGGARLALDDTGCGFADQQAVEVLRPDFIKLCITIIRSVGRNPKQVLSSLTDTIAHLRQLGVGILAEGVETEHEAGLLSGLDIDYAQGWLYGKPFQVTEGQWRE